MNSNKTTSFLILVLIAVIVFIAHLVIRMSTQQEKIYELQNSVTLTINSDSLRSSIERKIIDSLSGRFEDYDKQIRLLKISLTKNRKQNEDLQIYYNSVRVVMPAY
jgi:uncharacterized protein HemX